MSLKIPSQKEQNKINVNFNVEKYFLSKHFENTLAFPFDFYLYYLKVNR